MVWLIVTTYNDYNDHNFSKKLCEARIFFILLLSLVKSADYLKSYNLRLKTVFLFQSFLVITVGFFFILGITYFLYFFNIKQDLFSRKIHLNV